MAKGRAGQRQTKSDPDAGGGDMAADLSYEQAVEAIEEIIERIEGGDIGLEDSLAQYERGTHLIRRCRALLDRAEQRIAELDAGSGVGAGGGAGGGAAKGLAAGGGAADEEPGEGDFDDEYEVAPF